VGDSSGGISRRRFIRDAGLATVAAAELAGAPSLASARRRRNGRPTVAVFGGGVAGLTTAQELAERGFAVTVYERRAWGGKARSTEVPGSAAGGRRPLPGEHGYRVEPGFYENLPDTLKRIPFGENPNGVFDNLVETPQIVFMRDQGRRDLWIPTGSRQPRPNTPELIVELMSGLLLETNMPPDAVAYFADRMVVFLSSCDARRHEQWENTTWTDFIGADRYSEDYRKLLANLPRWLQASKPAGTSADFVARALESIIYAIAGLGTNGPAFRLLNAPTDEAWIDPWRAHLRSLGVSLRLGDEVRHLAMRAGRISSITVRNKHRTRIERADWYVSAVPHEQALRLWTPRILAADPRLERMRQLRNGWMNGIKFFLREALPITAGPFPCLDAEWAISAVIQAQFWKSDFASTYGDGSVRDSLSAVIADWDTPGPVYGKAARDCTPDEVAHETWEQLKRHVNNNGQAPMLTDDLLHSWDIDPGMKLRHGHLVSGDPLAIPTVGSRSNRPNTETAIANLILAGDYLQSDWWIGSMESACESGRLAANAILAGAGSHETPATVFPHYRPPEWEPLKRIDEQRHAQGQPNIFDTSDPPPAVKALMSHSD
jgi:uncharacterized protein with NAD-binding domain and iron-sulfur cluster